MNKNIKMLILLVLLALLTTSCITAGIGVGPGGVHGGIGISF